MIRCAVHHVRHAGPGSFIVRFDRHGLAFEPGQHLSLGPADSPARREYSIYSGIDDDFLEVLVREILDGVVSSALSRCAPGHALAVEGPYGLFITDAMERTSYLLLHGIRRVGERLADGVIEASRLVTCVSGEDGGDFAGRVTGYLEAHPVDPGWLCCLCGNGAMIDDAFTILRAKGVSRDRIIAEVYY